MHKITKGLKKKKKKSKHKGEDELFKPEELEQYRREHQQQQIESGGAEETSGEQKAVDNDEWKKFNALTAGVDSILKKTQGDLDRIKSTSFFKRTAPPRPPQAPEKVFEAKFEEEQPESSGQWVGFADNKNVDNKELDDEVARTFHEEESEEESEEDQDDIFDTSYIDVVASGEIKLAYIPESPTDEADADDFDPFDTSVAEKIIRGPEVSKKGKKLVPIGPAVEVLTGRVELNTGSAIPRKSTRRGVPLNQNLLLDTGTVDSNGNLTLETTPSQVSHSGVKSLLDDDELIPINEPIDLSKSLVQSISPVPCVTEDPSKQGKDLDIKEFDVFATTEPCDDLDDEFASLAAESLTKTVKVEISQVFENTSQVPVETDWNAFDNQTGNNFVEQDDLDFDPRAEDNKVVQVSIHLTNPAGDRESVSSLEHIDESNLTSLKPIHRDLLGGSTTDLTQLGNKPITPTEANFDEDLAYTDPFDTSIADQIAPGKTELKFIEAELLGHREPEIETLSPLKRVLSDPNFDPRADEIQAQINSNNSTDIHNFDTNDDHISDEILQPNTVIKKSNIDPFDTSFIASVVPGREELKLIEHELARLETEPKTVSAEKLQKILNDRENISKPVVVAETRIEPEVPIKESVDLLDVSEQVDIKVLTPAVERSSIDSFDISYSDPFDTSVGCNILPGKAELKLLENELLTISSELPKQVKPVIPCVPSTVPLPGVSSNSSAINFDTVKKQETGDLFTTSTDENLFNPLTPEKGNNSIDLESEDYDPFDTSITSTLAPGKIELKILESELIH